MAAGVARAAPAREAGGAGARTEWRVRAELLPHSRCAARVGPGPRGGGDRPVALTPPKPGRSRLSPHGLQCPGGRRGGNCQVSRARGAPAPGQPLQQEASRRLGPSDSATARACPGNRAASPRRGAHLKTSLPARSALRGPPPYGSAEY